MTVLGPEGVVVEVKNYLATNLGAKLTAVDARFSAPVGLVNVAEWRIDDPVNGRLPNALPCGWVIAPMLNIDQWGSDYQYEGTDIIVWLLIVEQDAQKLRQRLYRSAQAVWETLRAGHYDDTISWSILDAPELDFSEVLIAPDNLLFADARVRVRMYTREMN